MSVMNRTLIVLMITNVMWYCRAQKEFAFEITSQVVSIKRVCNAMKLISLHFEFCTNNE